MRYWHGRTELPAACQLEKTPGGRDLIKNVGRGGPLSVSDGTAFQVSLPGLFSHFYATTPTTTCGCGTARFTVTVIRTDVQDLESPVLC